MLFLIRKHTLFGKLFSASVCFLWLALSAVPLSCGPNQQIALAGPSSVEISSADPGTVRLEHIGSHRRCERVSGLAGWVYGRNEVWSLEQTLRPAPSSHGTRGVIVSFFATWCKPCRKGIKVLQELAPTAGEHNVTTVLVAVPPYGPPLSEYLREFETDLLIIEDKFGGIWQQWTNSAPDSNTNNGLPRTVVIDGSRRLVAIFGQEAEDFAAKLLYALKNMPLLCSRT